MSDQTVRIYCRGKPATARLANPDPVGELGSHTVWVCDSCGNRIRRVVIDRPPERKTNDRSVA